MARVPQISNAGTQRRLGTTPLGSPADADTLPSDLRADVVRIGGMRLEISQTGRIYRG